MLEPLIEINNTEKVNIDSDSLYNKIVEERCKEVLKYLFPNYEKEMTIKRYNNAMDALRSIAFGSEKV
jgi:hypothetical protein